jgi:nucleotide-binding universal stress UspA family protein
MRTLNSDKSRSIVARRPRGETKKTKRLKIQNVLVPLDFSKASHAALQFALPFVRRFDAKLHLVHVAPADSMSGLVDMPLVMPQVHIADRTRRDLSAAALRSGVQLQRCHFHARRGAASTEICELAQKIPSDLIVMATRGNTGLKHLALGSTAERVVRSSSCPVLVVRDKAVNESGNGWIESFRGLHKILVPIDFSPDSMKALTYAKALAKEFGTSLLLLHAVNLQYYVSSDEYARYDLPLLMQQKEKAARELMRNLVQTMDWEGIKINWSVQIGHAGDQVCGGAKNLGTDLIVTSTHGTTGLKRVLIGSTAEYIVRHAPCPVLVVPNRERS